jgi:aldehyde dehydrogenase (NAD+)
LQREHRYTAKTSTAAERKAKLAKLREVLLANQEPVAAAIYADLRRAPRMAISAEVMAAVADIDDAIENLDAWMQPQIVEPSPHFAGAKAEIRPEARGQVLVLGPWNFPIGLIFQPLVPAIAAGNCVVCKPNEMAPHCSAVTAKIIREAFDERDCAVVEGGIDTANELLALPFDHVFFTGSPAVGKVVMAAAARHLASVTLELGGKSPTIVHKDADLASAAMGIAAARCINSGQLCLSPDHVWAHRSIAEQLADQIQAAFNKFFYVDDKLNGDAVGKIIDDRNFQRVTGYIEDAVARGAQVVAGGKSNATERTVEPTLLLNVPLDAKVMNEEIFAPILPFMVYDDKKEILDYVQSHGKPLALYIYSNDQTFIEHILAHTSSGGVTINGVTTHCAEKHLPFGGVNTSGIGRYHGVYGFRELSHERSIFISA